MRSVGESLREDHSIAAEMKAVEEARLWRGAQAIAFSFACPGFVALISPSHLGRHFLFVLFGICLLDGQDINRPRGAGGDNRSHSDGDLYLLAARAVDGSRGPVCLSRRRFGSGPASLPLPKQGRS